MLIATYLKVYTWAKESQEIIDPRDSEPGSNCSSHKSVEAQLSYLQTGEAEIDYLIGVDVHGEGGM
jgi:hypothetical protein